MILVLDASAAIEIVLDRPSAGMIERALSEADFVMAPDLYVAEISNVIWKLVSHGGAPDSILGSLDDAIGLIDEFVESRLLYRGAVGFGIQRKHSVYDNLYLILARRNNATFTTLDRAMSKLALDEGLSVVP